MTGEIDELRAELEQIQQDLAEARAWIDLLIHAVHTIVCPTCTARSERERVAAPPGPN